jgi:rfaE bifunctional protein nucleotidyltransferase chain/domain
MSYPFIDRMNLKRLCDDYRARGFTIGMTAGCFDILHLGHVELIGQLRQIAEIVVVGLNSDTSVRRLKGDGRPFNNHFERGMVVKALAGVHYVVLIEEETPCELIRVVQPHFYMKGGDYDPLAIPEKFEVDLYGGKVLQGPLVQGHSTTALARRLSASTGILERSQDGRG